MSNNNNEKNNSNVRVSRQQYKFEKRADVRKTLAELWSEKRFFTFSSLFVEAYVPAFFKNGFVLIVLVAMLFGGHHSKTPSTTSTTSKPVETSSTIGSKSAPVELDASKTDYSVLYQDALNRLNKPEYAAMSASEKDRQAKMFVKIHYGISQP